MLPECLSDAVGAGAICDRVRHQPNAVSAKSLKTSQFFQAKRYLNAGFEGEQRLEIRIT
jgi:hypothetical protein